MPSSGRVSYARFNRFFKATATTPRPITSLTSLTVECAFCGSQSNLHRCSTCKVVLYCSKDHQIQHHRSHQRVCDSIKERRVLLDEEEKMVKKSRSNSDLRSPDEIIDSATICINKDCFCTLETQRYMFARLGLIGAYREANTYRSIELAINLALDTYRLAPCDTIVLRDITAAFLIRMGRDQEAYDFLKYWLTNNDRYDCQADDRAAFMDVHNQDLFEPVEEILQANRPIIIFCVFIALIKIKLLADLKNLRNSEILRCCPKLNYDCIDYIKQAILTTDYMKTRYDILRLNSITKYNQIIDALEKDIGKVFWICGNRSWQDNYQLWDCLTSSTPHSLGVCCNHENAL